MDRPPRPTKYDRPIGPRFGSDPRFKSPAPATGCALPPATLVERANGKIVSERGTFGNTRRVIAITSGRAVCPRTYYQVPDLTRDGSAARSHGVVVTQPRFQSADPLGFDSPGPIFAADESQHVVRGGSFQRAERFSGASPSPEQQAPPPATCDIAAEARALVHRPPSPHCKFGVRPVTPGESHVSPVHCYSAGSPGVVPGGTIPKGRRALFAEALDATPGPGHFDVDRAVAARAQSPCFSFGRRLRRQDPGHPGPGFYDLRLVDARLRRHRR